jgi:hypothetical protein
MIKVRLYAIGTSTTLESNKSLGENASGLTLRLAGDIAKAIGRRLPETLEMRCEKEEQHEMEERRFYMDIARD